MIANLLAVILNAGSFNDADETLSRMRSAYQSVHSALFYVRFEATDFTGRTARGEARYEYSAPDRFRGAFKGAAKGPAVLLGDGKKIAIFGAKEQKMELTYSPVTLGRNVPTNLETIAFFDSADELSTGKGGGMHGSKLEVRKDQDWDGKRWTVLRETNHEDEVQVDYYIDPKTFLIWRTLGNDLRTKKPFIDATITALLLNPKIDPERFRIPSKKNK